MPLRRETSLDKEEFSASKPTPLDKASIKDLIHSMRRIVCEMDTFGVAARLILHKGVEIVRWTYRWRCWMHRWIYIILLGFIPFLMIRFAKYAFGSCWISLLVWVN